MAKTRLFDKSITPLKESLNLQKGKKNAQIVIHRIQELHDTLNMFTKAFGAAEQSARRVRQWIEGIRGRNMQEQNENVEEERRRSSTIDPVRLRHPYFFEPTRSHSEPNTRGLIRIQAGYDEHDSQRRRCGSLPTGTNGALQSGQNTYNGVIYEESVPMSEQMPCQYRYNENENLQSGEEISIPSQHRRSDTSNERRQIGTSSFSLISTNPSVDSGCMTNSNLQLSLSNSHTADCNLYGTTRDQTRDSRAGGYRHNTGQFGQITRARKNGSADSASIQIGSGSDQNVAMRERQVSVCSITKITRSFLENDFSSKQSVFTQEVIMKSLEEITLENVEKSTYEGEGIDIQTHSDPELPQSLMSQVMSSRGPITGRVKLCLQHFEASKVLRVIILRVSNLKAKKGHVYGKLSAQFIAPVSNKKKVKKLTKQKASSEVSFNEQVYFNNIDEDDMERLTLSVRLYNREGMFRPKRCLGEMVIPLFKYDLSMDTNVKGNLRQQRADLKTLEIFDDEGDLEVISEDRSIAACVAASLNKPALPKSPRFKRMSTNASCNARRGRS